jgi:TonB family protein
MQRAPGRTAVLLTAALLAGPLGAAGEEPIRVAGSDVPAPKRTKSVSPVFPEAARTQGLRGIVIVEVVVGTDGSVESVDIVRSVPPFDEAAIAAVREWKYEPTKVDGKPVRVRLTVPITFSFKLPEMSREAGIPELRQGVAPGRPPQGKGSAVVVAVVEVNADGLIVEARVQKGEAPWSDALIDAIRTWRFGADSANDGLTFEVTAEFPENSTSARLQLSGARRPARASQDAVPPDPAPAPPTPAAPSKPEQEQTAPRSEPRRPASAGPTGAPAAPVKATPATTDTREATPAGQTGQPSAGAAPITAPPTEVVSGPAPPPTVRAPAPVSQPAAPGVSAVRDIVVGPGVPDITKGRRPMYPPLARMAGVEGSVTVRFSVDASGAALVQGSEGPEGLKVAAEQAVASWAFRRTSTERLFLTAVFTLAARGSSATVNLAE